MEQPQYALGRRIAVRGVTGSGKSTLARNLGEALGLRVIELDAIHWQRPDWQALPAEEFRAQVLEAVNSADGWVIEGNYSVVADIYLEQIDTLVWLHLPWRVSFPRMVSRTFQRTFRKELLWGAQRESLWSQLFSKNSLWWWGIHHHRASVRSARAVFESTPHIHRHELRTPKDVEALLAAARRQAVR